MGLLSWNVNDCLVDLEKELAIVTEQGLEGEEARYGERLIQFASENLVTEILIHPSVSTLAQCVRNLLSSFTRHRHIIHAGYTFAANGSWILQDGTFSLADFSEAFQEIDVQRVIRAYDNGISLDIHCSSEGEWARLPKDSFTRGCKVRINPDDVLDSGSPAITNFVNYIAPFLVAAELESTLESSDVVGNIRFSRPTLYVFPGGQGDAALFGINGFNMLVDGGFSRKACFWDFVRHLDRLDAVMLTRLNNSNASGIGAVLRRKAQNAVYPQIGHFFCNIQSRRVNLSPDGDKDKDPLLMNLLEEGQDLISNLRSLELNPQLCYRDSEPINLYHKVGHGTLDMYVLNPAKDSREVKEFLLRWNNNDQKLFANHKFSRECMLPLQNIVSICALLVWRPANPNDTITRILFPGSAPQSKIFEGLDRLKNLECIKHTICTEKSLVPPTKPKSKENILEKISLPEKPKIEARKNKIIKQAPENKITENNMKNGLQNGHSEKQVKKSGSVESDKSDSKPAKPKEDSKIIENNKQEKQEKVPSKPKTEINGSKPQRQKLSEKKPSPPTPKKTVDPKKIESDKEIRNQRVRSKISPSATPAKSTKDANNKKVLESKTKSSTKKDIKEPKQQEKKEEIKKVERKPISRRPKTDIKLPQSPVKRAVNGVQKPDSISRKSKLDKDGTTDSSTVSTPSADQDSLLKKDLSKLTPEEVQQLKAQELAELKEEQEAIKELEAVFRKGDKTSETSSDLRKIKDISSEDKEEQEEYLIVEKEIIEPSLPEAEPDVKEEETVKLARDSEESEKKKDQDGVKESADKDKHIDTEQEESGIGEQETDIEDGEEVRENEISKEPSMLSPEENKKITSKDDDLKELAQESQPDEKVSANIESGATTTAPTLPEDERIPLNEIKEDIVDQIEEKHVKEETKEKDTKEVIPVITLTSKPAENVAKLPSVVGIRLDKESRIRDIVKTPDEVADLPVHEEVDAEHLTEFAHDRPEKVKLKDDHVPPIVDATIKDGLSTTLKKSEESVEEGEKIIPTSALPEKEVLAQPSVDVTALIKEEIENLEKNEEVSKKEKEVVESRKKRSITPEVELKKETAGVIPDKEEEAVAKSSEKESKSEEEKEAEELPEVKHASRRESHVKDVEPQRDNKSGEENVESEKVLKHEDGSHVMDKSSRKSSISHIPSKKSSLKVEETVDGQPDMKVSDLKTDTTEKVMEHVMDESSRKSSISHLPSKKSSLTVEELEAVDRQPDEKVSDLKTETAEKEILQNEIEESESKSPVEPAERKKSLLDITELPIKSEGVDNIDEAFGKRKSPDLKDEQENLEKEAVNRKMSTGKVSEAGKCIDDKSVLKKEEVSNEKLTKEEELLSASVTPAQKEILSSEDEMIAVQKNIEKTKESVVTVELKPDKEVVQPERKENIITTSVQERGDATAKEDLEEKSAKGEKLFSKPTTPEPREELASEDETMEVQKDIGSRKESTATAELKVEKEVIQPEPEENIINESMQKEGDKTAKEELSQKSTKDENLSSKPTTPEPSDKFVSKDEAMKQLEDVQSRKGSIVIAELKSDEKIVGHGSDKPDEERISKTTTPTKLEEKELELLERAAVEADMHSKISSPRKVSNSSLLSEIGEKRLDIDLETKSSRDLSRSPSPKDTHEKTPERRTSDVLSDITKLSNEISSTVSPIEVEQKSPERRASKASLESETPVRGKEDSFSQSPISVSERKASIVSSEPKTVSPSHQDKKSSHSPIEIPSVKDTCTIVDSESPTIKELKATSSTDIKQIDSKSPEKKLSLPDLEPEETLSHKDEDKSRSPMLEKVGEKDAITTETTVQQHTSDVKDIDDKSSERKSSEAKLDFEKLPTEEIEKSRSPSPKEEEEKDFKLVNANATAAVSHLKSAPAAGVYEEKKTTELQSSETDILSPKKSLNIDDLDISKQVSGTSSPIQDTEKDETSLDRKASIAKLQSEKVYPQSAENMRDSLQGENENKEPAVERKPSSNEIDEKVSKSSEAEYISQKKSDNKHELDSKDINLNQEYVPPEHESKHEIVDERENEISSKVIEETKVKLDISKVPKEDEINKHDIFDNISEKKETNEISEVTEKQEEENAEKHNIVTEKIAKESVILQKVEIQPENDTHLKEKVEGTVSVSEKGEFVDDQNQKEAPRSQEQLEKSSVVHVQDFLMQERMHVHKEMESSEKTHKTDENEKKPLVGKPLDELESKTSTSIDKLDAKDAQEESQKGKDAEVSTAETGAIDSNRIESVLERNKDKSSTQKSEVQENEETTMKKVEDDNKEEEKQEKGIEEPKEKDRKPDDQESQYIPNEPVMKTEKIKIDLTDKPEHAEAVLLKSTPESPVINIVPSLPSLPTDIDKAELGRKSPKEREEDVAKIVVSVATVLKSDAPLEVFHGKIPISTNTPFVGYTTELRETHITTCDSPVNEQLMHQELIHGEVTESDIEPSRLMDLESSIIHEKEPEDDGKADETEDSGTVHRMLVTASSEDGGEETEICPPGTIIFSKSSESSGRSSPENLSRKPSQSSSILDTISDPTTVKESTEAQPKKDVVVEEVVKSSASALEGGMKAKNDPIVPKLYPDIDLKKEVESLENQIEDAMKTENEEKKPSGINEILTDALNEISEDAEELKESVSGKIGSVFENIFSSASKVGEVLSHTLTDSVKAAESTVEEGLRKLETGIDDAKHKIEKVESEVVETLSEKREMAEHVVADRMKESITAIESALDKTDKAKDSLVQGTESTLDKMAAPLRETLGDALANLAESLKEQTDSKDVKDKLTEKIETSDSVEQKTDVTVSDPRNVEHHSDSTVSDIEKLIAESGGEVTEKIYPSLKDDLKNVEDKVEQSTAEVEDIIESKINLSGPQENVVLDAKDVPDEKNAVKPDKVAKTAVELSKQTEEGKDAVPCENEKEDEVIASPIQKHSENGKAKINAEVTEADSTTTDVTVSLDLDTKGVKVAEVGESISDLKDFDLEESSKKQKEVNEELSNLVQSSTDGKSDIFGVAQKADDVGLKEFEKIKDNIEEVKESVVTDPIQKSKDSSRDINVTDAEDSTIVGSIQRAEGVEEGIKDTKDDKIKIEDSILQGSTKIGEILQEGVRDLVQECEDSVKGIVDNIKDVKDSIIQEHTQKIDQAQECVSDHVRDSKDSLRGIRDNVVAASVSSAEDSADKLKDVKEDVSNLVEKLNEGIAGQKLREEDSIILKPSEDLNEISSTLHKGVEIAKNDAETAEHKMEANIEGMKKTFDTMMEDSFDKIEQVEASVTAELQDTTKVVKDVASDLKNDTVSLQNDVEASLTNFVDEIEKSASSFLGSLSGNIEKALPSFNSLQKEEQATFVEQKAADIEKKRNSLVNRLETQAANMINSYTDELEDTLKDSEETIAEGGEFLTEKDKAIKDEINSSFNELGDSAKEALGVYSEKSDDIKQETQSVISDISSIVKEEIDSSLKGLAESEKDITRSSSEKAADLSDSVKSLGQSVSNLGHTLKQDTQDTISSVGSTLTEESSNLLQKGKQELDQKASDIKTGIEGTKHAIIEEAESLSKDLNKTKDSVEHSLTDKKENIEASLGNIRQDLEKEKDIIISTSKEIQSELKHAVDDVLDSGKKLFGGLFGSKKEKEVDISSKINGVEEPKEDGKGSHETSYSDVPDSKASCSLPKIETRKSEDTEKQCDASDLVISKTGDISVICDISKGDVQTHLDVKPSHEKKLSISDVEIFVDDKSKDSFSLKLDSQTDQDAKAEGVGSRISNEKTMEDAQGIETYEESKVGAQEVESISVPTESGEVITKQSSHDPKTEKHITDVPSTELPAKEDVRSITPASDDYELTTQSEISSSQLQKTGVHFDTEKIEDSDDDLPGSPRSMTSQVHHHDLSEKMDPMSMSFYGALPDERDDLLDDQHISDEADGKIDVPLTHLHDITKAKFDGRVIESSASSKSPDTARVPVHDPMTSSFYGELPSGNDEKDPIASWGKPLGLPSPAPPNEKGTPKKERKLPSNVMAKNRINDDRARSESPSKNKKKVNPVYVDLTYVPHHGNSNYAYVDFFKRVRARYYVFSGIEPSREVYNALLEAKQTWEDKDLEVTIIPTYDTDVLGYWVAENEELLAKYKIDLSPSASRCTINLQDHETSCSAYRLEF